MIFEGSHSTPLEQLPQTNKKLAEIKGELTTPQAQEFLVKYLHANPSAAAQLLMGVDLYPFQDLMIRTMFQKNFFLGVCGRGLCIEENSIIDTDRGKIPIKDVRVGDKVLSLTGYFPVVNHWSNPPSDGLEIVTPLNSFQAIFGHKTLCYANNVLDFKLIEDIKVGEYVVGTQKGDNASIIRELRDLQLDIFKVTSINPVSNIVTYDISVDTEPCYRGNGIVHHNSKSFTTSVFAPLYAIFNQGVKIGICSSSFRQSKAVFTQIEDFMARKEGVFLRQCLVGKPLHNPDAYEMKLGASKIVCLPLGSGERIRGARFNLMIIDELLLLSEKVINEVIRPFMAIKFDARHREKVETAENRLIEAGKLDPNHRSKFIENKLIGLTSASYEFEYLYELYSDYKDKILDPKAKEVSHALFQLSHAAAPKGLYSESNVIEAQRTMSRQQFEREYCAQFTGDSGGYFSAKRMLEATIESGHKPCTEIQGDKEAAYILALDPNYNDSENADHFAMCLLKLVPETESAVMVHGYALSKSSTKKRIEYLQYLFDNFNIVYTIADAGGGSRFLEDIKDLGTLDGRLKPFEQKIDAGNWSNSIREAKIDFDPSKGKIGHIQKFSSNWIREANEYLKYCFEQKKIMFASSSESIDGEYDKQIRAKLDISKLEFQQDSDPVSSKSTNKGGRRNKSMSLSDLVTRQADVVKLTRDECSLIVVSSTAQGTQQFDLPPELKKEKDKPNRTRRDSYSALLLGAWGVKCYYALNSTIEAKNIGFVPHFIA